MARCPRRRRERPADTVWRAELFGRARGRGGGVTGGRIGRAARRFRVRLARRPDVVARCHDQWRAGAVAWHGGASRYVAREGRHPMIEFPRSFLWGTATSAYQVEGSPLADGAGPSIWHRFSHTPNLVTDGATGDVACDHYRRYRDDVAIMRDLGTTAYRFSISWSRVLPSGRGAVNAAGLDFYERLVDALLGAGIEPMVTL